MDMHRIFRFFGLPVPTSALDLTQKKCVCPLSLPVARPSPFGKSATAFTSSLASNVRVHLPVRTSHTRAVLSAEPVAKMPGLSAARASALQSPKCPEKTLFCCPVCTSQRMASPSPEVLRSCPSSTKASFEMYPSWPVICFFVVGSRGVAMLVMVIVFSIPPVATSFAFELRAHAITKEALQGLAVFRPVYTLVTNTSPSCPAVATCVQSLEKDTSYTFCVCPFRSLFQRGSGGLAYSNVALHLSMHSIIDRSVSALTFACSAAFAML
mmetsp:Transcript_28401/g.59698  ORF Transcript_28401/g.59698 Transcript_28401/m.59698 type:complete len:268 (+) Transcript_28401:147-950(+)